jgi:nucleoside-diphosphate-sugar epimerase
VEQTAGKNMKVLIIGGTGFISSSMTRKLLEKGHQVTHFNRGISGTSEEIHPELNYIKGDRNKTEDLRMAALSDSYDVVYDMAAYEPAQTAAAVNLFRDNTERFIHCSTISVYMVSNDVTIPITEDQDNKPLMEYNKRNPFGMDYGIDKRKCEEVLWEKYIKEGFPMTIIRPTFVCGPEDPARRDYFWIERILDGRPLLVPGSGDCKFQNIYVEDCAEIFCRAGETEISIGQAYNAAAEEVFTLNSYLKALGKLLDREIEIVHIDQDEFDKLDISYSLKGDVFPFNTRRDAVFSLDKVKSDLKYKSTLFDHWMEDTIKWYLNADQKHSTGYEYREEELKIIENLKARI